MEKKKERFLAALGMTKLQAFPQPIKRVQKVTKLPASTESFRVNPRESMEAGLSWFKCDYFLFPNVTRKPVEISRSFPLIPSGGLLRKLSVRLNCQPSHRLIAVESTLLNVNR